MSSYILTIWHKFADYIGQHGGLEQQYIHMSLTFAAGQSFHLSLYVKEVVQYTLYITIWHKSTNYTGLHWWLIQYVY